MGMVIDDNPYPSYSLTGSGFQTGCHGLLNPSRLTNLNFYMETLKAFEKNISNTGILNQYNFALDTSTSHFITCRKFLGYAYDLINVQQDDDKEILLDFGYWNEVVGRCIYGINLSQIPNENMMKVGIDTTRMKQMLLETRTELNQNYAESTAVYNKIIPQHDFVEYIFAEFTEHYDFSSKGFKTSS